MSGYDMASAVPGGSLSDMGDEPMEGEEFVEYDVASELVKGLQQMIQLQAQMLQMLGAMQQQLGAPKQILRDEAGRVIGLAPVQRGQ